MRRADVGWCGLTVAGSIGGGIRLLTAVPPRSRFTSLRGLAPVPALVVDGGMYTGRAAGSWLASTVVSIRGLGGSVVPSDANESVLGGATSLIGRRAAPPVSRIIGRMDWRQREDGDRTRDN